MLSKDDIEKYIQFAKNYDPAPDSDSDSEEEDSEEVTISPTTTTASDFSSLVFGGASPSSDISYTPTPDPHAVSRQEAHSYYHGLHSEPALLYRTGEKWSPPRGPEAQRRRKELCEVFGHPITKYWNDELGWKVADVMKSHTVRNLASNGFVELNNGISRSSSRP